MKNQQDNFPSLSALLRAADSVDTLETNSLCCAAAGIIAPSSATADALIPHEKLRGATLADATLNAQERPLAQPVVGYTHSGNNVPLVAITLRQIDKFVGLKKCPPLLQILQHCPQRDTHINNPGERSSPFCDSNWESINTREAA